jgi:hypothetical protein
MPERMSGAIQAELLQDRFQPPLDEVLGVQATTFPTQEKWLLGVAFPPTSLNRGGYRLQVAAGVIFST